eukprot:7257035-Pyramimonas_sp.AAC.1
MRYFRHVILILVHVLCSLWTSFAAAFQAVADAVDFASQEEAAVVASGPKRGVELAEDPA